MPSSPYRRVAIQRRPSDLSRSNPAAIRHKSACVWQPIGEARIAAFHNARWEDRLGIIQGLDDERLRWFGLRLIYFEARSVLPEPAQREVERYLIDQLTGDGSGCLTFDQAMAETDRLLGGVRVSDDLLTQYRAYLQDRRARLDAYRTRLVA